MKNFRFFILVLLISCNENNQLNSSSNHERRINKVDWKSDLQRYIDLIPQIKLPYDYVCETNFEIPNIDYSNDLVKKYKPEGATIIAKLFQDGNTASIVYGYSADKFLPIISIIDKSGREIKEVRLFSLKDCSDDYGFSSKIIGKITSDYKIVTKTIIQEWNPEDNDVKIDSMITEKTIDLN